MYKIDSYLLSSLECFVMVRPVKILAPDNSVGRDMTRDAGGPGSNSGVVGHYFSIPINFGVVPTPKTDKLTSARGRTRHDL